MTITIAAHPIPDGSNLFAMYGAPNCVLPDCVYTNQVDLDETPYLSPQGAAIDPDLRRELLFHFETDLYDNLWTQYEFYVYYGECDDVSVLSTCTIETDAIPWALE
jgi:hypothetical protein